MLDRCVEAVRAPSCFIHTPDYTVVHSAVGKYNCAFSLSCAFYRQIETLIDTTWGFWNCFCSAQTIGHSTQDCPFITIADNPRVYISIETFLFFCLLLCLNYYSLVPLFSLDNQSHVVSYNIQGHTVTVR